jgi:hypothetical protein
MPNKQITGAIRTDNPAPVQLNRSLVREMMRDQNFIQRILEGKRRIPILKTLTAQQKLRPPELVICD